MPNEYEKKIIIKKNKLGLYINGNAHEFSSEFSVHDSVQCIHNDYYLKIYHEYDLVY